MRVKIEGIVYDVTKNDDGSFNWPAGLPTTRTGRPLTVAENVLAHGTGALNIDGCRIEAQGSDDYSHKPSTGKPGAGSKTWRKNGGCAPPNSIGRWPANVIHDGSDEVLAAFPAAPWQQGRVSGCEPSEASTGRVTGRRERVPSGEPRLDTGSAARFFYSAKASKADRAGSKHPTVKPIALMRYLCRLVTPPGGRILDPFAGSGTTGQAALEEGFTPTLIEAEAEYVADIKRRLAIKEAERAACAPTEERQGVLL